MDHPPITDIGIQCPLLTDIDHPMSVAYALNDLPPVEQAIDDSQSVDDSLSITLSHIYTMVHPLLFSLPHSYFLAH
jgi:hypothetical protein